MFTGIIKDLGTVTQLSPENNNLHITIRSRLTAELSIDQSVAHNGVCLTVVSIHEDTFTVTAIQETLNKTTIQDWKVGEIVNLELALQLGARLDGHLVQGHVDGKGQCLSIENQSGSFVYTFEIPTQFAELIIEKGSICINGVSLTAFNLTDFTFQVAIIPYTFEHTTFKFLKPNDWVNLEFDILGKYFNRKSSLAEKGLDF